MSELNHQDDHEPFLLTATYYLVEKVAQFAGEALAAISFAGRPSAPEQQDQNLHE